MHLATLELRELLQSQFAALVFDRKYAQCHEHFVRVQTRVVAMKEVHLGLLNGLYHPLGDEFDAMVDSGQMLGGIEDEGGAGAEQVARF